MKIKIKKMNVSADDVKTHRVARGPFHFTVGLLIAFGVQTLLHRLGVPDESSWPFIAFLFVLATYTGVMTYRDVPSDGYKITSFISANALSGLVRTFVISTICLTAPLGLIWGGSASLSWGFFSAAVLTLLAICCRYAGDMVKYLELKQSLRKSLSATTDKSKRERLIDDFRKKYVVGGANGAFFFTMAAQSFSSHDNDDYSDNSKMNINPATGLPTAGNMPGAPDVHGNAYGVSPDDDEWMYGSDCHPD